jgi:Tfp pilus assembly protein PilF
MARDTLREACDRDPGDADAWYLYGVVLESLGETAPARDAYSRVLLRDPSDLAALVALGGLEVRAGRMEEARVALESALAVDPGHAGAHALMADVSEAIGDLEGTLFHLWSARDATRDPALRQDCRRRIQVLYRQLAGGPPADAAQPSPEE